MSIFFSLYKIIINFAFPHFNIVEKNLLLLSIIYIYKNHISFYFYCDIKINYTSPSNVVYNMQFCPAFM